MSTFSHDEAVEKAARCLIDDAGLRWSCRDEPTHRAKADRSAFKTRAARVLDAIGYDALVAERDRLAQVVEASVTQLAAERDHFKAERDRLREALINNDEMIEGLVAERDRLVLAAQGVVRADGLADIGEPGADMAWDAALSELARLLQTN